MNTGNDLDGFFAEAEAEVEGADNPETESVDTDDVDVQDVEDEVVEQPDAPADDVEVADSEAEPEAWDWEAYADQLVPRTVNGETEMVPLKEAIDGSMRQADYTRKSQQVAELEKSAKWAQDVRTAFERDPMGTLQAFAQAYGLDNAQPEQDPNQGRFDLESLDEDARPWAERTLQAEQQLAAMQSQMKQLQNDRIQREVRREIDTLKANYGESFDPVRTLEIAAARNIPLEDAHWIAAGQRMFEENQRSSQASEAAQVAAAKREQQQQEQRTTQKRRASSGTGSFKATDVPTDDFNDIGELMEALMANEGT
jgi:hypothetical protein